MLCIMMRVGALNLCGAMCLIEFGRVMMCALVLLFHYYYYRHVRC